MVTRTKPCNAPGCRGTAHFANGCGAWVCEVCDAHVGLCKCFCGWSASGGDGRRELIEDGETIEDES
jgi:hypothetical protein